MNKGWYWRYFEIEPGTYESAPFNEMDIITPEQCMEAIRQSRTHGNEIELYLNVSPGFMDEPLIGLVFRSGAPTNFGLGGYPESESIEERFRKVLDSDQDRWEDALIGIFNNPL